jgi:hypothetical protein
MTQIERKASEQDTIVIVQDLDIKLVIGHVGIGAVLQYQK